MTDQREPREEFDEDPELRSLLRRSDPAASLSAADPTGLADLLHRIQEDDMTEQTTTSSTSTSSTSAPATTTPTRRRGTWLAAAAAAVIVGGGGYAVVSGLDDDNAPGVAQNQLKSTPTVLRLEASAPAAGRCAVPTPEILAQFDVAFAGTVTAVEDDVAVLEPTEVFVGDAVDSVEVTNFADVRLLGAPVDFAVGESYLVAATDGVVSPCGFSGPAAGDLRQLYDAAFR